MRRLMAITAFALFLAVPVWAQRGGGGHGGGFGGGHAGGFGGHAAFGGGHAGGFGGRAFGGGHFAGGGMRSAPAFNRGFAGRPFVRGSRGPYLHDGFRNNGFTRFGNGFNNRFSTFNNRFGFHDRFGRFHNRFGNCWGRGCNFNNWGWGSGWGWGWGWPWWGWWDNDDYNYDQDYYNNLAAAQQMNEESLEEQQMREEEAENNYPPRVPRQQAQPPAQPQSEKEAQPVLPPTVLVFRDQHKQEVENYAIVGQTLWAFSPQHQKIPLSQLDLPATQKANEDRGVEFRVPSSGEGQ
jgi:hypothetical protein